MKMYKLTNQGKSSLVNLLKTKVYEEVNGIMSLLNKQGNFTEEEVSGIINFMSRYPYYEVADILSQTNLSNIFLIIKEQKKELVDRSEIIKEDINPNKE